MSESLPGTHISEKKAFFVFVFLIVSAVSMASCGLLGRSDEGSDSNGFSGPAVTTPAATLTETVAVTATATAAVPFGTPTPIPPAATFSPFPEADKLPVVNVELKEGSISVNPTSLTIGIPYKFVIVNKGSNSHSFEVRTATIRGAPSETLFGLEGREIRHGSSAELIASFRLPGPYQIVCPLEGHREAGEIASFGVL